MDRGGFSQPQRQDEKGRTKHSGSRPGETNTKVWTKWYSSVEVESRVTISLLPMEVYMYALDEVSSTHPDITFARSVGAFEPTLTDAVFHCVETNKAAIGSRRVHGDGRWVSPAPWVCAVHHAAQLRRHGTSAVGFRACSFATSIENSDTRAGIQTRVQGELCAEIT
jgi:hypothetical protein